MGGPSDTRKPGEKDSGDEDEGNAGDELAEDEVIIGEEEICLYDLPMAVGECLVHSFWGISMIDLSPGTGELAASTILQSQGYLGICHSISRKRF